MAYETYNDIGPGRSVVDLGCGTGILAIACALLETDLIWGIDCDDSAIQVAMQNVNEMQDDIEINRIAFVLGKIKNTYKVPHDNRGGSRQQTRGRGPGRGKGRGRGGRGRKNHSTNEQGPVVVESNSFDGLPLRSNMVDTVITNPPFGTKWNEGMDVQFLKTASRLATRAVYSFHKSSTRQFLLKTIQEQWGFQAQVIAQMKFDLPQSYKFHKQKSVDIDVDLIRIQISDELDNESGLDQGELLQEEDTEGDSNDGSYD